MVKTTQKSDLPWSAIFSLIVCWSASHSEHKQNKEREMFKERTLPGDVRGVNVFGLNDG